MKLRPPDALLPSEGKLARELPPGYHFIGLENPLLGKSWKIADSKQLERKKEEEKEKKCFESG